MLGKIRILKKNEPPSPAFCRPAVLCFQGLVLILSDKGRLQMDKYNLS